MPPWSHWLVLCGVCDISFRTEPKATTLSGYGIVDAFTQTQTNSAIQSAINSLVNGAGASLDTLKELAAALGNDPNFSATVLNLLTGKANQASSLLGYGITDAYTKTDTVYLINQAVGALLPKRTFGVSDFIRIPDAPGGLILQFGSIQVAPETTVDVTLPLTFNNTRGAVATMSLDAPTAQGVYSAYARLINGGTIRLTQDVTSYTGAGNQYINYFAWGN